ncbi:MAG: glycosyl hydrolase, partial [Dehalococcoidia bacterium]
YGQDPHCVVMNPAMPDRLYQQNHCGIYRMDRPDTRWVRIGENVPKNIEDWGFPLVTHPRDPDTVWFFPLEGTRENSRVNFDGKPATYVSRDAGATWQRQDRGLPQRNAWFTTKRQAMAVDSNDPVGVYFGTTGGEVWGSINEGEDWTCLAAHLPEIYSVEVAQLS